MTAFNKLPDEIIVLVLEEVILSGYEYRWAQRQAYLLQLMLVCRRWNTIATRTPTLWTRVNLTNRRNDELERLLARSGALPLHGAGQVRAIRFRDEMTNSERDINDSQLFHAFRRASYWAIEWIHSKSTTGPFQPPSPMGLAPHLRRLSISSILSNHYTAVPITLQFDAPELRYLDLDAMLLDFTSPFCFRFPNLVTLRLSHAPGLCDFTVTAAIAFFPPLSDCCPVLEWLELPLNPLHNPGETYRLRAGVKAPICRLCRLQTLIIQGLDCDWAALVVNCIAPPNLCQLGLTFPELSDVIDWGATFSRLTQLQTIRITEDLGWVDLSLFETFLRCLPHLPTTWIIENHEENEDFAELGLLIRRLGLEDQVRVHLTKWDRVEDVERFVRRVNTTTGSPKIEICINPLNFTLGYNRDEAQYSALEAAVAPLETMPGGSWYRCTDHVDLEYGPGALERRLDMPRFGSWESREAWRRQNGEPW